jgi:cytochrome c-type biogenesis protein
MIIELFSWLTKAIEGTPYIALIAAFIWGILSILLSPCHLASIPLIIGYIDEQGRISIKRAFWISVLFALGILDCTFSMFFRCPGQDLAVRKQKEED